MEKGRGGVDGNAPNVNLSLALSSTRSSGTTNTTPPNFLRTEMASRAANDQRGRVELSNKTEETIKNGLEGGTYR